jgi:lysophospholipase L1-like esterase
VVTAGLFEAGSRLVVTLRARRALLEEAAATTPAAQAGPDAPADLDAIGRALSLNPYEMVDPRRPSRWRLRPGCTLTLSQLLEAKRRDGHDLAVRYLRERAGRLGVRDDEVVLRIDAAGYRGPEVDPAHRRVRILALGDSCTFGTALGEQYPYPRVLEGALRRAGRDVEVINAGVEGYGPVDVLARLDELKALRPEITTIYLGWNALFDESFFEKTHGTARYSAGLGLLKDAYEQAMQRVVDPQERARAAVRREKHPDPAAPEVAALADYRPWFLRDLERVVAGMQSAGSRVVLITLPGLYVTDEAPSPRALAVGYLPLFTDNPYVLAQMARAYNDSLRSLAARQGLLLIDLDRWSRRALEPREAHFFDSVHLYEESQALIGEEIARQLTPFAAKTKTPLRALPIALAAP